MRKPKSILLLPEEGLRDAENRLAHTCLSIATEWNAPKEVIDALCRWIQSVQPRKLVGR